MQLIRSIDALHYDFADYDISVGSYALVGLHVDMDDVKITTLVCPRQINNTEYVWHPQSTSNDNAQVNTYVSGNGKLKSVAFSDVVATETPRPYVRAVSTESQTRLHVDLTDHDVYAITENRLMFICGPRDLNLSDTLQDLLDRLNDIPPQQKFSWYSETPLTEEISKIGKGLGVFFMYRGRVHMPLQGCGSRPSPLFAPDNEVTVDPITGTRSCVVDPMSKSRIGFICEGRIEPEDCMKSLIDQNGEAVDPPHPHMYWDFDTHVPWVAARYFNDLAVRPFNGECKCIDTETEQVKARIEVRSKTDYICDIASMILRNRFRPIRGPWCSVMLHPGSTLTIKLPKKADNWTATDGYFDDDVEGDSSTLPFSQMPSIYEYETDLMPNDMATLRQLASVHDFDIYDEILYHKALAGDALELDVSKMPRGEVKLHYNVNNPLALRNGVNSFLYHWTLISRNETVLERVRATVSVSFAFTYRYNIVGCDRWTPSMFEPTRNNDYLATKPMGNGIGTTYEWLLHVWEGKKQAGIRCGPNEELLPGNCDSTGYDLYSNQIMPFAESVRNATLYPIRGFQVFEMSFLNIPVSYACICVDQHGYERSRLTLGSNHDVDYSYIISREEASQTLLPYSLLAWGEVAHLYMEIIYMQSIRLHHVPKKPITLHVGTALYLHCALDDELKNAVNDGFPPPTWLPSHPAFYYYTLEHTAYGPELIRKRYKDIIAGTKRGFDVYPITSTDDYYDLRIKSDRGAILISKDPDNTEYVPMTFVCGKELRRSDFGLFDDDTHAPVIPHATAPLERYTWHLVEVAVEMTDPYMQGCGVTQPSVELFKPETPKLYDSDGNPKFGCKIDLHTAREAAFYCPAPYVLDPPNCFSQVSVDDDVKNLKDFSQSLVVSHSNHFVILEFDGSLVGPGETLRQTPPLECRCVTVKGAVLSTIQIENYYAK
ncbi:hypothetical protein, conserved [Babesia ovata]|uniref:6-Cys domain-containing protein n=1 Tax=Babesia ovata TaxID=189622 RepID=A0A2H6K6T7_9APIC|nr:uncharacterized protein BOVATA_001940 [Babesia ovata]GBE58701.1 hypothetical protein, conserved [Babesia ovata]